VTGENAPFPFQLLTFYPPLINLLVTNKFI